MTRFAPACTAFCSTSSVAIEVVTTPVTTVDGSPALKVSTVSLLHSTPMFFLMRSTISCAVTPALVRTAAGENTNVVPAAPPTVSATNLRRERWVIEVSRLKRCGDASLDEFGLDVRQDSKPAAMHERL